MKLVLYFFTFFILLCSSSTMKGQSVYFQGCTAEFGSGTYELLQTGTTDDNGTIRNTFETTPIDGAEACNGFGIGFCEFRIIWDATNVRWAFQMTDGVSFYDIYTNDSGSHPNPPDLSLGTWSENVSLTNGGCGGDGSSSILELFGEVQSTIVLPVELLSFESKSLKNKIELTWITASELNNEKFEIEESQDGRVFQKIGEVKGNGTTTEQQKYSFEVKNPKNGFSYYRLKQIDFDGAYEYSEVRMVSFGNKMSFIITPNPSLAGGENFLILYASKAATAEVQIFNIQGKLLLQQSIEVAAGNQRINLPTSDLPVGTYTVRLVSQRGTQSALLIKN